jgi:hypothetical protein
MSVRARSRSPSSASSLPLTVIYVVSTLEVDADGALLYQRAPDDRELALLALSLGALSRVRGRTWPSTALRPDVPLVGPPTYSAYIALRTLFRMKALVRALHGAGACA